MVNKEGEIVNFPVATGKSLGIFDHLIIDQQHCTIPRGGLVLFFSDGLYEAFNSSGQAFGIERVKELLVTFRKEKANMICEKLWTAVQEFSEEIPHQDDFTTVIVKRH